MRPPQLAMSVQLIVGFHDRGLARDCDCRETTVRAAAGRLFLGFFVRCLASVRFRQPETDAFLAVFFLNCAAVPLLLCHCFVIQMTVILGTYTRVEMMDGARDLPPHSVINVLFFAVL